MTAPLLNNISTNLTSSQIISYLTGYARKNWKLKYLTMLKAYIDESKSEIGDRCYIMAGYVHHAEAWEQFISSWQFVLDQHPKIDYLHAVDAQALIGQFGGWDKIKKDAKLIDLSRVVEHYKPLSFSVTLNQSEFDRYIKPVAPYNLKEPYFYCFWAVVLKIAEFAKTQGENHSVSFIFDDHNWGDQAAQWFSVIKESQPYEVRELLKSTPRFEDDKLIVPLQASDALAWHLRRNTEERNENLPALENFIGENHLRIDIDIDWIKQIAIQLNQVEGVELIQTKREWKRIKKGITNTIMNGDRPQLPRRGIWFQVIHKIKPYFRFRYLTKK